VIIVTLSYVLQCNDKVCCIPGICIYILVRPLFNEKTCFKLSMSTFEYTDNEILDMYGIHKSINITLFITR